MQNSIFFSFLPLSPEHHKVEKENYHIMLLNYSHEAAAVDIDAHGRYRMNLRWKHETVNGSVYGELSFRKSSRIT